MHFGDYPNGAYWSAERRPLTNQDEPTEYTVSGPVIRMMWDYGVRIPLWDAEGLLPEEPEWLRMALGLSDGLTNDLRRWGLDMIGLDATAESRTHDAYVALDERARGLVQRLRDEIGSRWSVEYSPWR